MSLMDSLGGLRELADKVRAGDTEEYKDALNAGLKVINGPLKNLLEGLRDGDDDKVEASLTKWEDVNKTLVAIGKMDSAIERAENGVSARDVLAFISKAAKVGITIGLAAL